MSGFGFSGGFGQNNQQQNTGFGGFGQAANTTANTGFGAPANTGFGAAHNTGGMFGGNTGGGFGSSTSAFGAAKPTPSAFGAPATTGTPLFGGTNSTTPAFGGGFGASTNTGGLFGAKPAQTNTFGTASSTPSAFGSAPSAYGAPTAFGGAAQNAECTGTGSVPFAVYSEKVAGKPNETEKFHHICFMTPYQKFSLEELRLADYAQGRKHGTDAGQTGAFGQSTGFGGFGGNQTSTTSGFGAPTSGGLFGGGNAPTASSNPFGQSTSTFGNNPGTTTGTSGGGLFGAKPATGHFGSAPSAFGTSTTTQPTSAFGSAFGTNTTTQPASGFGSAFGSTPSATTPGGLFGNNNAPQNKPSLFGAPAANNSPAFGTNTTPAFGSGGASSNPFGAAQQTSTTNPFGAPAATQQPASNAFGQQQTTNTSGGLFGAPKAPTGSLFGAPTTTTTPAAGGLFGGSSATTGFGQPAAASGGGLFAKPAAPAATSGGLFGSGTQQSTTGTTGGGLFGNTQGQQPAQNSGGLFGGLNNQQQNKPSLFGAPQTTQSSGGLFGGTQQGGTGSTGGLFGGNAFGSPQNQQSQQNNGGGLFGSGGSSLFGGAQQNNQQQQQPQQQQQQQPQGSFTTSINDPQAFGNSMFASLASPIQNNPGPLATPLSSLSKQKKAGVIPLYKLNPAAGSRLGTPQRRGFGFSYSTYGTPGAISSVSSTPGGYGTSLLGNSLSSSKLIKSSSTSGLRHTYNSSFSREDSILAPGAFAASPSAKYNSSGSMKRLVIDRGIRGDLFSPPVKDAKENGILKKRVSFEPHAPSSSNNGVNPSPLKQVHTNAASIPSAEELGFLRSSTRSSNGNVDGASETPEMEQVRGNELAVVPEQDASPTPANGATASANQKDQEEGEYWMKPTLEEIKSMNRTQRQNVSGFTVGRNGVGCVRFDAPVDLSNIDIDNIFGKIVILSVRSATVYPDNSLKPPMGQGLNVPSTIELENSWPRQDVSRVTRPEKVERMIAKHIDRLKRIDNADFVSYDREHGVWTFKVPHFTTYGLDYDDSDDDMEGETTLGPEQSVPRPNEESFLSQSTESELQDDTFDFKKRKMFPGTFDMSGAIEDDVEVHDDYDHDMGNRQSFLDERSVGSLSGDDVDEPMDRAVSESNELVRIESNDMAGSYPQPDATAEHQSQYSDNGDGDTGMPDTPGGLLRARLRLAHNAGTPLKKRVQFADDNDEDWANMLRQTISPQKRDRADLKRIRDDEADAMFIGSPLKIASTAKNRIVSDGRGFATSIDLMHSLFEDTRSPRKAAIVNRGDARSQGFEWPYKKTSKTVNEDLDDRERAYHNSVKPSWGPDGTLVYRAPDSEQPSPTPARDQGLIVHTGTLSSEGYDIRISRLEIESKANSLAYQQTVVDIKLSEGVPQATLSLPFSFKDFACSNGTTDSTATQEQLVWELASILFDETTMPDDLRNVPAAFKFLHRDQLSSFWERLVEPATLQQISLAKSDEEKAVAALAGHRVVDACSALLSGKNFHLATLVALLDGNEDIRESVQEQLEIWRESRALSEINHPIRAIYEILAGNVCVCAGSKKGVPIEDRIDSFVISKQFGLEWRQAFGLRLWYSISNTDELKSAVASYIEDLALDKEASKPFAWYVEQNISPLWDDQHLDEREDLLWGLLKLYSDEATDLESVLRPENSQLSPFDMRLTWQLSQALTASGKCSYGNAADEKADALTTSFASQLNSAGHWLDAIFALLHLSNAKARGKAIQDQLSRHAGNIGAQDSTAFITLVEKYKIPAAWVWSAKALYMRAVAKDPKREVECLISASAFDEAHRTFCRDVAPNSVIERDYEALEMLLKGFEGKANNIADWELGGGVYVDYLKLLAQQKMGKANAGAVQLAERLLKSLPAMVASARGVGFMQKVAAQEMSGAVAEVLAQHGKAELANGKALDHSKTLRLPMTEDRYLKHTADLSLDYYRATLTGMVR